MEIEIYTVDQLSRALLDKKFWFQNVAPITKHRAQFVINNPRSEKEDPVLFIAKEEDEIIGFRLVFPDKVFVNNHVIKIGWGSSFWVNDKYRGKGIGRALFERSLELWKGNIGSLVQSKDAARVYEGNPNFYCFRQSEGYQFIIKLNLYYWIRKRVDLPRLFSFVFSVAGIPVNTALGLLKLKWLYVKKPNRDLNLEYCLEISDSETTEFVRNHNKHSLLQKEVRDINAIIKYPTSIATPLTDVITSRYFFSTKALRFEYLYVKLYDKRNDVSGLLLMNIEGNEMKLLYYFYRSEDVLNRIFDVFLLHAVKLDIEIVSTYDDIFIDYLKKRSGFPFLYSRQRKRKSFLPNHFKAYNLEGCKIFDGDGA